MALQTENEFCKNPKNRCRICLETTNGKIELNQSIYHKKTEITLRELLEFCVNAQVRENENADGLCLVCMEQGIVCYDFKKKFEESKNILMKELEGNSFKLETEEELEEYGFVVEAENTVFKDENKMTINCDICGKIFNSRSGMLRHKRKQHVLSQPAEKPTNISLSETEEIKCEICGKVFKLRASLVRHKRKHTEAVKCSKYCSYVPESPTDLAKHKESVHADRKEIPCTTCGKIFFKWHNLRLHMLIHSGKKHTCEYCGLSFTLSGNLASHRRIHTGEKPYTCSECGKGFAQQATLKSHQAIHSNQRDHVCQKCGASFTRVGALLIHMKRHSAERPYKCTMCPKAFVFSSERKRHMVTHTGVQKYACDICGKMFNRSTNRNVHRKIHTGETPHVCQVCGKGFIQAHCLKTHMNKHLPNKH